LRLAAGTHAAFSGSVPEGSRVLAP